MTNINISHVLLVGACVRPAAESAHAAGYTVTAIDLFGDSDTRKVAEGQTLSDYPHGIYNVVSKYNPDAICFTGALENHPSVVQSLRTVAPVFAPTEEAIANVRSPESLQRILAEEGFNTPDIAMMSPANNALEGNWLVKPLLSAAGLNIQSYTFGQSIPAGFYLQQFVAGITMSASFLVRAEQTTLLGFTEQFNRDNCFQFCGAVTGTLEENQVTSLERLGALLRRLKLYGLLGVDFILTNNGEIYILEVNPRYTATMELLEPCWQAPLLQYHIESFTGEHTALKQVRNSPNSGKLIIYAQESCHIDDHKHRRLTRLAADQGVKLSDLPFADTKIEAGHPVLTVLASCQSPPQIKAALDDVEEQIQAILVN